METVAWNTKGNERVHWSVVLAFAAACIPIVLVGWFHLVRGVPIQDMTRDVAAIGGIHPLAGFLSSLGILVWATSAAIWVFSAVVLYASGARARASFALGFGLLSWFLVLDDSFQFHEALAPDYLGMDERLVYALLGTATLALLVRQRRVLLASRLSLLTVSFLLLGASTLVDVLSPWLWRIGYWAYLLEDGLKWLGIVCWSAYAFDWCKTSVLAMRVRE